MTSRTNKSGGVKVHAVLIAVILYQCTTVVGNPLTQWINSLPAGSQYHPIVEHFLNCYKTVSTQTNNDIGFMKCLTLINSLLKTDSPDKTSFNNLSYPPADLNVPRQVLPPRRPNKVPESILRHAQENNDYVTTTLPNSKVLLYELKKLWDLVKDNPRLSANRQIVEKLNRMRATLQQNPTQQNIMNLIADLRGHLKYSEYETTDDENAIFRNNILPLETKKPSDLSTTPPVQESTLPRKIIKPKPTIVTVPTTEVSNEDEELSFRANFISDSTPATIVTEISPTYIISESPTFKSQFKTNKINEVTEKTPELITSSTEPMNSNLHKYKVPERPDKSAKILASPAKIKQQVSETVVPPVQTKISPRIPTHEGGNIEISPRFNIEKVTTENPEKFTKIVRNNFLLNHLVEKQPETSDSDDELSARASWPANDLIAQHAQVLQVPHAVEELPNDIYTPHINPQLQNFIPNSHPAYTQFYPPYSSYSPPQYAPHAYLPPLRPEDDPAHIPGVPTPNHFYQCN